MGHASSSFVLMNLVRLGNQRVLETYNCKEFRKAAIEVTRLTTGKAPHPKQVVYGERAVDLVFGFIGVGDFNLGDFFGEKTINRITTLATPQMIVDRMVALFGENPAGNCSEDEGDDAGGPELRTTSQGRVHERDGASSTVRSVRWETH